MTFEQTMHTIESHLETLQEQHNNEIIKLRHHLLEMQEKDRDYSKRCQELQTDYDRLLTLNKVLEKKVEALNSRVNKPYEDMKVRYARLLEKNKMLKVENKMLKVENEKLNDMLDEQERSWL